MWPGGRSGCYGSGGEKHHGGSPLVVSSARRPIERPLAPEVCQYARGSIPGTGGRGRGRSEGHPIPPRDTEIHRKQAGFSSRRGKRTPEARRRRSLLGPPSLGRSKEPIEQRRHP